MSQNQDALKLVKRIKGQDKRRVPRIALTREQFKLTDTGKIFAVQDLSLGGLALRILEPQDMIYFTVSRFISGTLNLNGRKVPIRAQVRHIKTSMAGCEFIDLDPDTEKIITQFLDPSELGRALRASPESSGDGAIWFHGPTGTDLMIWRGIDGEFNKFSLFLLGNYVQWELDAGLMTGIFQSSGDMGSMGSVTLFEDKQVDEMKLELAKKLILSSQLTQELKRWCTRKLDDVLLGDKDGS
ncbi:MAG: PilZ domain-containing protein [Xanthomonadaceae bacterium]|nr:PilZ domain-containing protein [Xanthomonadaceae bacterium]